MTDDRYRSRYAPQPTSSDEDRMKAWAEVNAVWERFMPSRRGESIGSGGLILHSSNGSKVTAEHVNTDGPGMSIAWRRMVDKARKEIAEHEAKWMVRDIAAEITTEELQHDLLEIRTWANSLRKTDL